MQEPISGVIPEPEEGAYAANAFKLDLEPTTGHDPAVSAPARFVVQIRAIHVEILTDLLDLVLFARQPLIQSQKHFHDRDIYHIRKRGVRS